MTRGTRHADVRVAEQAVIHAAREYVTECENPAPDLNERARLRSRLSTAVHDHDRTARVVARGRTR